MYTLSDKLFPWFLFGMVILLTLGVIGIHKQIEQAYQAAVEIEEQYNNLTIPYLQQKRDYMGMLIHKYLEPNDE